MEYREQILEILDIIKFSDKGEDVSLAAIGQQVFRHREKFLAVHEHVKDAPIAKSDGAIVRMQEWITKCKEQHQNGLEQLGDAYVHFLDRVANSPTQLHLLSIVPLVFPIIIQLIKEQEAA